MKQSGTYLREIIGFLDYWISRHRPSKNIIQQSNNLAIESSNHRIIQQSNNLTIKSSNNPTIQQSNNLAIESSNHRIIQQSNNLAIESSNHRITQQSNNLAIESSNHRITHIQPSLLLLLGIFSSTLLFSQKENKEMVLSSDLNKATVFFQGAQIEHSKSTKLNPGKQTLVFEKLSDFIDPNSIQVKATGNLTILAVSMRKNYEDKRISNQELRELNEKLDKLYIKDRSLRDEHFILQTDKDLLNKNSSIRGNNNGVSVVELKEAYTFIHARMVEISKRESEIEQELENLTKEINKLLQEIDSQRSKPVINYSEILVEIDVTEATNATFYFSYISPKASWTPYYDLRSKGIGFPVDLEAKAFVNQKTGIEWKDIDLVLSTNDPYQNAKESEMQPWYLNYNNYPAYKPSYVRQIPAFDYSGQKIRGEVIDASNGESMAFAKVYFSNNPNLNVVTDFEGKFEITVPKGQQYLSAMYSGYGAEQHFINAPYLKFFLIPNGLSLEKVMFTSTREETAEMYDFKGDVDDNYLYGSDSIQVIDGILLKENEKSKRLVAYELTAGKKQEEGKNISTQVVQKDLRVEYTIQSKFTVPSDGMDQRVSIQNFELPANYEYHAAPKIDPAVYLTAQITGWEKMNLLNGESNIYFDGTFIGKSYIDVNSTKDTLTFSLGKDAKMQVLRTKISEKSKTKTVGSRQKFDIAWEIKVKNNGGAEIPLVIKDQFPISTNDDIKVKLGDVTEGKRNEETGIIVWNLTLGKNQSKSFFFDYSVDYQKGVVLYLE